MAEAHPSFVDAAAGTDVSFVARRLFGNVRLHFSEGRETASRLVSARLGLCRLTRLEAEAHVVDGQNVLAGGNRPDMVKLIIQTRGWSQLCQGDRKLAVGPKALVIYDPAYSYRLDNPMPVEVLMLQLPRDLLPRAIAGRLRQPLAAPLVPGGLPRVLVSMMETAAGEMERLDAAGRESLGRAMAELMRTIMTEKGLAAGIGEPLPPLALLGDRIKDYVGQNVRRPDLDAADIACKMGCSVRYVYRAFEAEGTTPADYIWSRRLAVAAEALRTRTQRPGSIADIAFEFGFSSSAHFSRLFRQRYDRTPSQWRQAAE